MSYFAGFDEGRKKRITDLRRIWHKRAMDRQGVKSRMVQTIEKREAPVLRRIFGLLSERGKTEGGLAEYLAVRRTTVLGWKRCGGFLYKKYIYEICDYLDTTPNYLFPGPEEEKLSPEELKILRRYRRLSSSKKKRIMDELRELAEKTMKKN